MPGRPSLIVDRRASSLVAGIDGCPAGWFYVAIDGSGEFRFDAVRRFEQAIEALGNADLVLVDIPIGLPGKGQRVRHCDVEARRVISPRGSTLFPAPSRAATMASSYEAGCAANRQEIGVGLSRQCWGIVPKIREVDRFMRRIVSRPPVREMHPEVAFWSLNGNRPLLESKKSAVGLEARLAILTDYFEGAEACFAACESTFRRRDVARDDIVDAMAGAVTALQAPRLSTFPARPRQDSSGLVMEIVYARV